MNIKKMTFVYPVVLICAVILKVIHLNTGFDIITGAPLSRNIFWILLCVLSVVVVAFLYIASRSFRDIQNVQFCDIFEPFNDIYKTIAVITSVPFFVYGAVSLFVNLTSIDASVILVILANIIFDLLSILTGFAIVAVSSAQCRAVIAPNIAYLSTVPMFWVCFKLVLTYRDNAANPFISSYVFELFAVLCLMFSFYLFCGFIFNKSNISAFVFFSMISLFFACITTTSAVYNLARLYGSSSILSLLCWLSVFSGSIYVNANLINFVQKVSVKDSD